MREEVGSIELASRSPARATEAEMSWHRRRRGIRPWSTRRRRHDANTRRDGSQY